MELRSRNILGSPVFALDKGENLGRVKDYVFDPEKRGVAALIIAGGKGFRDEKLLPLANIKALGIGAVTIADTGALITKNQDSELAALMKKGAGIIGINVITTTGTPLGRATDFFVEGETGAVTCIALGGKTLDRFIRGNNFLAGDMVEVYGSDVILARENAVATTVKPGETRLNIKGEPKVKEAYSGSIWNQGKEKIMAKTKEYTKKAPAPKREDSPKENPSGDRDNRFRTKGKIFYKNGISNKDEKPS